jgi:hypothetical protein
MIGGVYSASFREYRGIGIMRQLLLVLTALIGCTSTATGGEELWKKYTEAAVGRYVAEGVIPTDGDVGELRAGDKFVMESTLSPAANGYALIGNQVLTVPQKPDLKIHSTITSGWDPADKAIEIAVYWSDGSVERATLDGLRGNALTGTYSLITSDGNVESDDVEMVITDNDHHVWKFAGGPNAGKPLSNWQRVKAIGHEDKVPEKVLKLFEYFVGDWVADGATRDGQTAEMTITVTWAPGKHMLLFNAHWSQSDLTSLGSGIFGWDAEEEKIHTSEFWDNNVYHHRHFTIKSEKELIGEEFAGVITDGKPIRCKAAFRILNADEWTFETSDVVIDGQPQPGGAKLKFRRK